jgi:hypothetical protein
MTPAQTQMIIGPKRLTQFLNTRSPPFTHNKTPAQP